MLQLTCAITETGLKRFANIDVTGAAQDLNRPVLRHASGDGEADPVDHRRCRLQHARPEQKSLPFVSGQPTPTALDSHTFGQIGTNVAERYKDIQHR